MSATYFEKIKKLTKEIPKDSSYIFIYKNKEDSDFDFIADLTPEETVYLGVKLVELYDAQRDEDETLH